jgi:hypothetical protein
LLLRLIKLAHFCASGAHVPKGTLRAGSRNTPVLLAAQRN